MTLKEFFLQHPKVAVAFSGGVDSSYLLYVAKLHGADVRAYFVKSQFQPQFELDDAQRLSAELDVPMTVLPLDVLQNKKVAQNTPMRCYDCKHTIFSTILRAAGADGYTVLLDGTNASDDAADRQGTRALAELQVFSPLFLCGLTKQQIRQLSQEAGLFTWDKPAYACLATRIPTGTPIDVDTLQKIELAEDALAHLGFYNYRVRVLGTMAKLQLPQELFTAALEQRDAIYAALLQHFDDIVLDLKPR